MAVITEGGAQILRKKIFLSFIDHLTVITRLSSHCFLEMMQEIHDNLGNQ